MPRRPSHLVQEDGPLARFALELRALRDAAGFAAPSVDQIAARTGIPRSTLFAALRGQRLPTRPVLGALVSGWGGDEREWLIRRTATEAELQAVGTPRFSPSPSAPSPEPRTVPVPSAPDQVSIRQLNGTLQEMAAELRAIRVRTGARVESTGSHPSYLALEAARQDMAIELRDLRVRAGSPSLRQLATQVREDDTFPTAISIGQLSDMFHGKRNPSLNSLLTVVSALNGNRREWEARWERLQDIYYTWERTRAVGEGPSVTM
ncbi:Helix-turn-helix protein [Streptomyces sp. ADI91-18]|nr:Helix-turn-helix protein [Streptomyces sp. ADI91-18]